MTNLELRQLRQLLFLSPSEASSEIGRVETRTWQRWEKGDRAIPYDVIQQMQMLSLTRLELLSVEADHSHYIYQYFDSLDEYVKAGGTHSVIKWRLSQSISAQLLSEKMAEIWQDEEIIKNDNA
ncbi:hypothetical protein PROPEN_01998 [Proteus penneri ATCC 35198]|nr:hypothetical protein PROPEN_01998 [Proteus penneri ATCC 35198]